jgi:hypothetical protein
MENHYKVHPEAPANAGDYLISLMIAGTLTIKQIKSVIVARYL